MWNGSSFFSIQWSIPGFFSRWCFTVQAPHARCNILADIALPALKPVLLLKFLQHRIDAEIPNVVVTSPDNLPSQWLLHYPEPFGRVTKPNLSEYYPVPELVIVEVLLRFLCRLISAQEVLWL